MVPIRQTPYMQRPVMADHHSKSEAFSNSTPHASPQSSNSRIREILSFFVMGGLLFNYRQPFHLLIIEYVSTKIVSNEFSNLRE